MQFDFAIRDKGLYVLEHLDELIDPISLAIGTVCNIALPVRLNLMTIHRGNIWIFEFGRI